MKTDRGLRTAILTAVFCLVSGSAFAVLSGAGTETNPYLIQSRADFDEFANPANAALYWFSGKYTKLMYDPNLAGTTYTQAVIAPDTSTTSGFQGTQFTGIFDGNGRIISNLTINAPSKGYIGLFGCIGSYGVIKNLGLNNVNLTGGSYVGGIVGSNGEQSYSSASIQSCYVTGKITGNSTVGGLAGQNVGRIKSCYATCAVQGGSSAGGLVGIAIFSSSSIAACYSTGSVSGSSYVGGLVGKNDYRSISSCLWDIQTSGMSIGIGNVYPNPDGIIGKTTAEMKDVQSYLVEDWSFVQGNITLADWIMPSIGYPKLTWEVYSPVTIPNLKGLTQQQAQTTLNGLGLLAGATYSVYDGSIPAGLISETYPKSGTLVYAGLTPVHLLTAQGTRYAGGDGAALPYQIADPGNLIEMINTPGDWNKSFIMTANIDLQNITFWQSLIAPDTSSSSGFLGTPFTGIFDGNGHVISNLTIKQPAQDSIGMFGSIGFGGQVKNLGIENVSVKGSEAVGGLAGANFGCITSCYTTGLVIGTINSTGGLVGRNNDVVVCSNSSARVQGYSSTGGLVGFNLGSIISCYATSQVDGSSYVGGLAGSNIESIIACYASGKTNGTSSVGGLTGNNLASITISYSTGLVSGTGSDIGGLVGLNSGATNACFWNTETSGQSASAGGTGKTTAEMQTVLNYTEAGWDFVGENVNGLNDYWQMQEGQYPHSPVIVWTLGGGGTAANPYRISSPANLGQIWLRPGDYYKLDNSLDLNGLPWTAAVIPGFTGVFDGSGFAISNLTINQPLVNTIGLFGRISVSAQIRNLELYRVSLNGKSSVGGLAGRNYGNLTSCSTSGTINGYSSVGGLIGSNLGKLTSCCSTCDVSGYSYCGGLVGYQQSGSITSCYATGTVSGTDTAIGGLVGQNYRGKIIQCYSSGKPTGTASIGGLCGIVNTGTGYADTGNFWDMETSQMASSSMGTGKTTAEMKTLATFTNAGWDFADTDGDAKDWFMPSSADYPKLVWQYDIGLKEFYLLALYWQMSGCASGQPCADADWYVDGKIDMFDLNMLAEYWMTSQMFKYNPPFALWSMDESAGTTVSDSVGDHHGQTVNMAGTAARVFKDFTCQTLDSWSCSRRVVGKAEHL